MMTEIVKTDLPEAGLAEYSLAMGTLYIVHVRRLTLTVSKHPGANLI